MIGLTIDGVQCDAPLSVFFGNNAIPCVFVDIHMTEKKFRDMCFPKILGLHKSMICNVIYIYCW